MVNEQSGKILALIEKVRIVLVFRERNEKWLL